MKDIKLIPLEELIKDRDESEKDIDVCETAMRIGIKEYSAGSVQQRLDTNRLILIKINEEIKRRESM
jgi:hypothetical protein